MNRGVFLDRDGVINSNVYNPKTGKWESPHELDDFRFHSGVLGAVKRLQDSGYRLFIVSNQPSYAKGKTSLENILAIAGECERNFNSIGVTFTDTYYCFHHPDSIISEYQGSCVCRKPSPYFLQRAVDEHDINIEQSWMIGDRETDILCGKTAGCFTIKLLPDHPCKVNSQNGADWVASNLIQAVDIILKSEID